MQSLTKREREILSQIASDVESGNHLLRTDDGWKAIGITKKEYNDVFFKLMQANVYFDWVSSDWNEEIEKQALMLLYIKSCFNSEFHELLKSFRE